MKALYVSALVIESGAMLNTNGIPMYYNPHEQRKRG